jgi:DNA-binding MarR family transcriptional regulator
MEIKERARGVVGRSGTAAPRRGLVGRSRRRAAATLAEQARLIAAYLPALMRQLFTFENDLVDELPLAQLRVCSLLHSRPRSMSAVSRELGVSLSAVTQVADRLERAGLVKRVPDGTDRRLRCLQLTEQGSSSMRRHEESRMRSVLAILERLPAAARADIEAALATLMQACAAGRRRASDD